MNESQGRNVKLEPLSDEDVGANGRRYSRPNRVLVRSFRISRDGWKSKHQAVQVKLEPQRQLAKAIFRESQTQQQVLPNRFQALARSYHDARENRPPGT